MIETMTTMGDVQQENKKLRKAIDNALFQINKDLDTLAMELKETDTYSDRECVQMTSAVGMLTAIKQELTHL